MADESPAPIETEEEPPPAFRSWGRLYAAVVAYLFSLITLLYLFTAAFSGGR